MCSPRVHFAHRLRRAHDWQDRRELDNLCKWWRDGGRGVCALVGIGGAGKTAIAERFLRVLPGVTEEESNLAKDASLRSPKRLLVFSFYEAPNADQFFAHLAALARNESFDESSRAPSFHETIDLLRSSSGCLLVLDGLEKLQNDGARGELIGKITDGRLRELVDHLAYGLIPGVAAIVTTRFPFAKQEEQRPESYTAVAVEGISATAGVALLKQRGVLGSDSQLERIAVECGHHALTVDLAGGYIAEFGDRNPDTPLQLDTTEELERRITEETDDQRRAVLRQEHCFARVAERYREGFAKRDPAALALLQRICLFRLGVDANTLASIFTGKGKKGIAGRHLARLSMDKIERELSRLAVMRLLETNEQTLSIQGEDRAGAAKRTTHNVHPAVRVGFRQGINDATRLACEREITDHFSTEIGVSPDELSRIPGRKLWLGGATELSLASLDDCEEWVHHLLQLTDLGEKYWQDAYLVYTKVLGGYSKLYRHLAQLHRGERVTRALYDRRNPNSDTASHCRLMNTRAGFCRDLGDLESSFELFTEARLLAERIQDDPDTLRECWVSARNLVRVQVLRGRLKSAKKLADDYVKKWKSVDPQSASELQSPDVAIRVWRATASGLMGETDRARKELAAMWCQLRKPGLSGDARRFLPYLAMCYADLLRRLHAKRSRFWTRLRDIGTGRTQHGVQHWYKLAAAAMHLVGQEHVDAREATKLMQQARDLVLQEDTKEPLCWTALMQAKIELAINIVQEATDREQPAAGFSDSRARVEEGLRIAQGCGFSIYHVDLLLLRAQLALHAGRAHDALRDVTVALDDGIYPAGESRMPTLLAATDPECGYAWGIAEGLHLRSETLLLKAAQQLGQTTFDPGSFERLPDGVRQLVRDARGQVSQCMNLRRQIRDPRITDTEQLLSSIGRGVLTEYPIRHSDADRGAIRADIEVSLPAKARTLDKVKILFLAANPDRTVQLWRDEEVREIEAAIRSAQALKHMQLVTKLAARSDDLRLYLNEQMPTIVHYSGHADESESLLLHGENELSQPFGKDAFVRLLTTFSSTIRLVFLNACFTKPQCEAVTEHIDFAIGFPTQLVDQAAIAFAKAFYLAIAFGRSVQAAFSQGISALEELGTGTENMPELHMRASVDANETILVRTH